MQSGVKPHIVKRGEWRNTYCSMGSPQQPKQREDSEFPDPALTIYFKYTSFDCFESEDPELTCLFLCVYVWISRSADYVRRQSLHHLLEPGTGWDWEAGGSGGSGLHSHVFRLVLRSSLALLRPGAPHWSTVAYSCTNGQAPAHQSHHGLT